MALKDVPLGEAYRLINPGPVLMISSRFEGKQNAMSLAWNMNVAKDNPPIICIGLGRSHFTSELVDKSGIFGVSIGCKSMIKTVNYLGTTKGEEVDKFKEGGVSLLEGAVLPLPLIEGCPGYLECKVIEKTSVGKIWMVTAEVVAARVREDVFSDRWLAGAELAHHLGGSDYYFSP